MNFGIKRQFDKLGVRQGFEIQKNNIAMTMECFSPINLFGKYMNGTIGCSMGKNPFVTSSLSNAPSTGELGYRTAFIVGSGNMQVSTSIYTERKKDQFSFGATASFSPLNQGLKLISVKKFAFLGEIGFNMKFGSNGIEMNLGYYVLNLLKLRFGHVARFISIPINLFGFISADNIMTGSAIGFIFSLFSFKFILEPVEKKIMNSFDYF